MTYLRAVFAGLVLVFVAIFVVFVIEPLLSRMGDESQFVFIASGLFIGGILCLVYQVIAKIKSGPSRANQAPNPFIEQRGIEDRKRARAGRRPDHPEPPKGGATIYHLKSASGSSPQTRQNPNGGLPSHGRVTKDNPR